MKLVLDADAVIKLARAEVLGSLTDGARCYLSQQVYDEVLKGKEKMYEDAFVAEALCTQRKIKVQEVSTEAKAGLGIGEWSSKQLFHTIKADAIVSDDRKFLSLLEREGVSFMVSTDCIVLLGLSQSLTKSEALLALEKIKPLVRQEQYRAATQKLGGI